MDTENHYGGSFILYFGIRYFDTIIRLGPMNV